MKLRDYQAQAVRDVIAAWKDHRRALLVMPTGSGKTATLAALMMVLGQRAGVRSAFLVHRTELCSQTARVLQGYGLSVGVVCGSLGLDDITKNVTVGTVQTLSGRERELNAQCIVIDEAHTTGMADEWGGWVTEHLARDESAKVIGATATPCRGDGQGLGTSFTTMILGPGFGKLMADGWLVPTRVIHPAQHLGADKIATSPVKAYLEHAAGKRAVVFAPNVKSAHEFAREFLAAGITCETIVADVSNADRESILGRLEHGRTKVVINVATLIEGIDVPNVECIILARNFGSMAGYLQALGRGLRPAPGKKECLVLDLVGNIHEHGKAEEDRDYSLTGEGIKRKGVAKPAACAMCGTMVDGDWTVCERCGFKRPELRVPRDVGMRMIHNENVTRIPDSQRAKTLAKWMDEGREKKYREGYAFAKYRGFWGVAPSPTVWEMARKACRIQE